MYAFLVKITEFFCFLWRIYMNSEERASAIFELRGELLKKGLTLQAFARKEGFDIRTVFAVIQRYWGTGENPPRGIIAQAILERLRAYVEHPEPPSEQEECENQPVSLVENGPYC